MNNDENLFDNTDNVTSFPSFDSGESQASRIIDFDEEIETNISSLFEQHLINNFDSDVSFEMPIDHNETGQFGYAPKFDLDALNEQLEQQVSEYFDGITNPFLLKRATGPVVHIGTDSEFEEHEICTDNKSTYRNNVISCQAYLRCGLRTTQMIYYPKSYEYKDRITLKKFISDIVNKALKEGTIKELPSMIYIYGHFLRADMPSFKSFYRMKNEVAGIGGTFASIMKAGSVDIDDGRKKRFTPEPINLADHNRHRYQCLVRYVDTMLHTPGRGGLAVAGEIIGLPKLKIPEGHSIERMGELLKDDKEAFEKYAMRDAEIACEYGLYLHSFVRDELGLKGLPATAGSCAVAAFKHSVKELTKAHPELGDFGSIFGVEYGTEEYWNANKQRNQTRRLKEIAAKRNNHKGFISLCYKGAVNIGFYAGPTDTTKPIRDLDLRGAYTIGLCDMFTFCYDKIRPSYNVADYLEHVAGFAHVRFKFPKGTRFPCLPISAGDKGLIFPLEGESYCTAPEILAAHNLGCEIEIIYGVIVPWAQTEHRLFDQIISKVRKKRNKAQAIGDKAKDAVFKNLALQIYGKISQSITPIEKNVFDTSRNASKAIAPSAISHEMMAAHTTGFVRAVILELLNQIPENELVVSVTTDGFLTTYPIESFDFTTPLCSRYQAHCDRIDGKLMLEEKGCIKQAIGMKTRGSLTAQAFAGKPPILAKAGVKPIIAIEHDDTPETIKDKQNEEMINLYLNRKFDAKPIKISSLISLRDMWLTESDLVRKNIERRVNLEYDFKRNPINPKMVAVRDTEHLAFDSEPWESIEQFKAVRAAFDAFRRKGNLKSMEDWYDWEDFLQTKLTVKQGSGINANKKGSVDILRRIIIRAYTQEAWGLSRDFTNAEIADWLTDMGYPTNLDELKNAKRANLVPHVVPVTHRVINLLVIVLDKFPKLDVQKLFPLEKYKEVLAKLDELKK